MNPGNIKQFDDKVKEIAKAARDHGTPIRIGVNAGSLDRRLLQKCGKATPEALAESALWEASLFEEHDFRDIKISVKHNDPVVMVEAYRQLAAQCDYPLHLGVTEAGPAFQGTIKSAVAFGAPALPGHRRHHPGLLSAPPIGEIRSASRSWSPWGSGSAGWRSCRAVLRACPGGRLQAGRGGHGRSGGPWRCRCASPSWAASSSGPGEAREADLGVASGNGKGRIFVRAGIRPGPSPSPKIVETLIDEERRGSPSRWRRTARLENQPSP